MKRPARLLMLAQMAGIAVMLVTAHLTVTAASLGATFWQAAGAVALGLCTLAAEAAAVYLCGVVRKTSAFCPQVAQAVGAISLAALAAGVLLLPLGKPLMDFLLAGLPPVHPIFRWVLPSFAAFTLAAMAGVMQRLLRRAVEMQSENDLTI